MFAQGDRVRPFSGSRRSHHAIVAVQADYTGRTLDPGRWKSFGKLQRELAHLDLKDDPLARAEVRRVWIGRHKAARAHMKHKRGGLE